MEKVIEKIAWKIPYNPAWLDRHDCEEGVRLVRVPGCDRRLWAIPREVESVTCFEPVYMTLVDEEPTIWFELEPPRGADVGTEVVLEEQLPEAVRVRVLDEYDEWQVVEVKPHVAVIQTQEDVEEGGICVAYSLPDAEPSDGYGSPDVYAAIPHMMRHIYEDGETSRLPFFFIWF